VLADPPMIFFFKITNGDQPGTTANCKFVSFREKERK
jgi:hypothetical protein